MKLALLAEARQGYKPTVLAYGKHVYRLCDLPAMKVYNHNRWVRLYQGKKIEFK